MKHEMSPSHVAVLVPSVRKAADFLRRYKFEVGEEETFEKPGNLHSGERAKFAALDGSEGIGLLSASIEKTRPWNSSSGH